VLHAAEMDVTKPRLTHAVQFFLQNGLMSLPIWR